MTTMEIGDLVSRDAEEPSAQGLAVVGRAVGRERVGEHGLHDVVGVGRGNARAYVRGERGNQPFVGKKRLSIDHRNLHVGSSHERGKV